MKSIYHIAIIIFIASFFPLVSHGATITFIPDKQEVSAGELVEVSVMVDTDGENINALEGQVVFPASLFSLERIETGSSVVTMWVDEPRLSSPGTINFSGAVFNGFDGVISSEHTGPQPGTVMRLILEAKRQGSGLFSIQNGSAYLHDGRGTEVALRPEPKMTRVDTRLAVEAEPSADEPASEEEQITTATSGSYAVERDKTAPEPFSAEIVSSPDLHNGQYVVVFNAQDTGSGIDHYEVMEVPQEFSLASVAQDYTWKQAESPYVLSDQDLTRTIIVKAVDKAGNERVVHLAAPNDLPWHQNYLILLLIVVIFILSYMLGVRSRGYGYQRRQYN